MRKLIALSLLLLASGRAWAGLTHHQPIMVSDGSNEGPKFIACNYYLIAPSPIIQGSAGHGCGTAGNSISVHSILVAIDSSMFGFNVTHNSSNIAGILSSGTATYSDDGACVSGIAAQDTELYPGGASLVDWLNAVKAWPGRYEIQVVSSAIGTSPNNQWYSSTMYAGSGGLRNTTGCYYWNPPSSQKGTVQIIVKKADGSNGTKKIYFRHPFGGTSLGAGYTNVTVTGTQSITLMTGRTLDFAPDGSSTWYAVEVSSASVNKYYVTVDNSGVVQNVSSQEANQGPADVQSYDGPPGEMSWWQQMLSDAFVPSGEILEDWAEWYQTARSWGPFGYVNGFFDAVDAISVGHNNYLVMRLHVGMIDYSFDFRDPATNPPSLNYPPYSQGSLVGTIRVWLLTLLRATVYGLGAVGLWRWLRPKVQV